MNWAKYADKKGKTADFKSKERVVQEAVSEVKDEDGKVVRQAVEEKKESYITMVEKRWNPETGEAMTDNKNELNLAELENEKANFESQIASIQKNVDGLAEMIKDVKAL